MDAPANSPWCVSSCRPPSVRIRAAPRCPASAFLPLPPSFPSSLHLSPPRPLSSPSSHHLPPPRPRSIFSLPPPSPPPFSPPPPSLPGSTDDQSTQHEQIEWIATELEIERIRCLGLARVVFAHRIRMAIHGFNLEPCPAYIYVSVVPCHRYLCGPVAMVMWPCTMIWAVVRCCDGDGDADSAA